MQVVYSYGCQCLVPLSWIMDFVLIVFFPSHKILQVCHVLCSFFKELWTHPCIWPIEFIVIAKSLQNNTPSILICLSNFENLIFLRNTMITPRREMILALFFLLTTLLCKCIFGKKKYIYREIPLIKLKREWQNYFP